MRIAYLVSQYPAPSHTFIRREVDELRRRGVDVQTFSVRRPSEAERGATTDRREYDGTWYVLPPKVGSLVSSHASAFARRPLRYLKTLRDATKHRVPGVRASLWSLFHFAEAIPLARELERRGVEHLHNHFANSGANVGYLASKYLGLGWSLTLHGISEFDYPAGQLLGDKIHAARFVACVSHFGRAQAMRIVDPSEWEKMGIVRCGVELHAMPERAQRDSSRLRVVCVGRLSAEKGHFGLLDSFASVIERGVDAELVLIGDGPAQAQLEAQVRRHGLEERVIMPGRLSESEVLREVAKADVFVLSSFMEGLPVVLMEALALEVPVVAPCVAGIPELVEHEHSGLLFSPSHWDELTERLIRVLEDGDLRRRLAAEGHRRVVEEFDIKRAVVPLLRMLGAPAVRDATDEAIPTTETAATR